MSLFFQQFLSNIILEINLVHLNKYLKLIFYKNKTHLKKKKNIFTG